MEAEQRRGPRGVTFDLDPDAPSGGIGGGRDSGPDASAASGIGFRSLPGPPETEREAERETAAWRGPAAARSEYDAAVEDERSDAAEAARRAEEGRLLRALRAAQRARVAAAPDPVLAPAKPAAAAAAAGLDPRGGVAVRESIEEAEEEDIDAEAEDIEAEEEDHGNTADAASAAAEAAAAAVRGDIQQEGFLRKKKEQHGR